MALQKNNIPIRGKPSTLEATILDVLDCERIEEMVVRSRGILLNNRFLH